MDADFSVCPHGPCAAQAKRELEAVSKRIEELMQKCRDGHELTYRDIQELQATGESS